MNVSLVQPNFAQGSSTYPSYWLPYSIACVYVYTATHPLYEEMFDLHRIVFRREETDILSKELAQDDLVLFGCYMWNWQYNLVLAEKIKQHNPNTNIIFGGPQVSEHRLDKQQKDYPFVDTWIISEGELSFREYIDDIKFNRTKKVYGAKRLQNLDVPSPYLVGFFDQLIKDNPDIKWNSTLETNRGCPFACTFCDWGSLTYAKVKRLPLERVFKDIEWISKNKIEYIFVADANFGMYPERDMEIAKHMVKCQEKWGYPEVWNANWHKNSKQNVIPIVETLTAGGKNRAMTISVQSMDDNVQNAIERRNMETTQLEGMFDVINSKGLSTYTELILPLPLETVETWRDGLAEVLRIGQHNSIEIWFHQLLENAESVKQHIDKYKFEIRELSGYVSGAKESHNEDILERTEVVVATDTMTYNEFVECWMYASMIINFHCGGWTQLISRVFVAEESTTYREFYDKLFYWLSTNNNVIGSKWAEQKEKLYWFLEGKAPNGFSAHTFLWDFNRILTEYRDESFNFINNVFCIDSGLLEAQKLFIHDYKKQYPINVDLDANYFDYLTGYLGQRIYGNYRYTLSVNHSTPILSRHLDNLYFKRRMGYGKVIVSH